MKTSNNRFAQFYELLAKMQGATKEEIVFQYSGGTSLRELYERSPKAYRQMIADMKRITKSDADFDMLDKWRKRVIAAIAGYFDKAGLYTELTRRDRLQKIISTACRAAGIDDLNSMTGAQMKRVYNEFTRKQKTADEVEKIEKEARVKPVTIRRGCLSVTMPSQNAKA